MKKKFSHKAIAVLVFGVIAIVGLVIAGKSLEHINPEDFDARVHDKVYEIKSPPTTYSSEEENPYSKYIKLASSSNETQQLKELAEKSSTGVFVRQAKQIVGELPEDAPRVTLGEAVSARETSSDIMEFMQILDSKAGAPDYVGGSGIDSVVYLLDDAGESYLKIIGGTVVSYSDGNTIKMLNKSGELVEPPASSEPLE